MQKIIVTTSPYKNYKTGKWMLSAVMHFQLETANNSSLANFTDVLKYMQKLKDGLFFVQWGNSAPLAIKPINTQWNTALYEKLFHKNIKVNGFQPLNINNLVIKSYPVSHIADFVMDAYKEVGNLKPTEIPKATFFTKDWKKLDVAAQVQLTQKTPLTNKRTDAVIGDFVKRGHLGKTEIQAKLTTTKVINYNTIADANNDFGQFHNFHAPTTNIINKTLNKIPQPEFEYHDILAILSSYPIIMRKLGLIIDFELPTAPINNNGTVRILPTNLNFDNDVQISSPATAYISTINGFFMASKPGSQLEKGMAKINNNNFNTVNFDTDAAAIKLTQHANTINENLGKILVQKSNYLNIVTESSFQKNETNLKDIEAEVEDKNEGLPTLRSAGIALVKNGLANQLFEKLNKNLSLFTALNNPINAIKTEALFNKKITGTTTPAKPEANKKKITDAFNVASNISIPSEVLYADDLIQGYRMDIAYEDNPTVWYSLHQRKNTYSFSPINGTIENIELAEEEKTDEGCIHLSLVMDENSEESKQEKISEVLARWQGWSLSVPKPGKGMNDGTKEFEMNSDEEESKKYKLNNTVSFRLQVNTNIAPKTLPMLRFGKSYRIKLRTVDVAGNGLPHNILPDNPTETIRTNIKYLRYEPLPTPLIITTNEIIKNTKNTLRERDGESLEHLVIRSNINVNTQNYESNNPTNIYKTTDLNDKIVLNTLTFLHQAVRHIGPPRNTQQMAELHSMFDAGFKTPQDSAETYAFITSKDVLATEEEKNLVKAKAVSVDALNIPTTYLADPMAAGVVFTMESETTFETTWKKGESKRFSFYSDNEKNESSANDSFDTLKWRAPKTFRIKIVESDNTTSPTWSTTERILTIPITKSGQIILKYASYWRPDDIDKCAALKPVLSVGANGTTATNFARRSMHWMVSPWRSLRITHAVQQPLKPASLDAKTTFNQRNFNDTFTKISTDLNVHGSSTDKVEIEATWEEIIDDLNETTPKNTSQKMHVDSVHVTYKDNRLELRNIGGAMAITPDMKDGLTHFFNDTKHRMVNYIPVATTRYREYFTGIIETGLKTNNLKTIIQTGLPVQQNILSSAKPTAPLVAYIVPSFNWIKSDKANELIHVRSGNIRIYLDRPWYSSGNGEKLAVVLPVKNVAITNIQKMNCTVWGKDPAFVGPELNNANYPQLENFPFAADYDTVDLAEEGGGKLVIAAYNVLFDEEKQMHYADIPIKIDKAYFPFVRLVVARYQRNSLRLNNKDCCLSQTVTCDWLQVVPIRYTGIYFKGAKNVFDVAVRGTAPYGVIQDAIPGYPDNNTKCRISITIENTSVAKTDDAFVSINNRTQGLRTTEFIQQFDLKRIHIRGDQIEFVERITLDPKFASQPFKVVIKEYELHEFDPIRAKADADKRAMTKTNNTDIHEYKERLVFMDVFEIYS